MKTTGPLSWKEGTAELYTVQSISSALAKKTQYTIDRREKSLNYESSRKINNPHILHTSRKIIEQS